MTTTHAGAHPTRASNRRHHDGGGMNESLSAIGEIVRAEVRRELDVLRERAGELVEEGKRKARAVKDDVGLRVSERPFTALLVAGGVGLLIGLMMRRKA
jgi:ElaB/YqjD/DUF883 family membrane-anchored ribosome-binding protein